MSTMELVEQEKKEKPAGLRKWVDQPEIQRSIANALAGVFDHKKFLASMIISLNDENLADCTEQSKFIALNVAASLGLQPSLGHVALIPRNIEGKGRCVTVMPQWQGLHAIMMRHPDVLDIRATLVHRTDIYSYNADEDTFSHTFDPFKADRTFASFDDVRGGYMVVIYRDPTRKKKYHFVTAETMQKARSCAKGDGIWKKFFYEQCLKTVYRNAYARRVVPIDAVIEERLQEALRQEDIALENDPRNVQQVSQPVSAIEYVPPAPITDAEVIDALASSRSRQDRAAVVERMASAMVGKVFVGDLRSVGEVLAATDEAECYFMSALARATSREDVLGQNDLIQKQVAARKIGEQLGADLQKIAAALERVLPSRGKVADA